MRRLRLLVSALSCMASLALWASDYTVRGQYVTIPVSQTAAGRPQVVRLQVVSDNIIRVQATSEAQLPDKQSLTVVSQTAKPWFSVTDGRQVSVKARAVEARVDKATGRITFYDGHGKKLLRESPDGKTFKPFLVPAREIGTDSAKVSERQRQGLTWHLQFDSPADEAFYGLGQHQSEELNMKGLNEELFQYNTKVSVPFVLSNRNYGLLWDSYSYCRWGNPEEYQQLGHIFKLYDKQGREGHLTGTYTDRQGKTIVRDEDSIYYEFDCPATSELARRTEPGGIKNLPAGFNLNGSRVVYEGFIEPQEKSSHHADYFYHFMLYYAGYIKVFVGGEEVVAERWRTAWNPNTYKFRKLLRARHRYALRIEWQPDGGTSYCGLRVARPNGAQDRLSIWSEMARDMDYYFIAGRNADEVISGYRTLTGKAPVYPKWVLGFWQSRERYKTADEVTQTLREFRRRRIPCDNIVQDWNYWKLDSWGDHTFEASRYPDPQGMIDSIHAMGGRFMISVWPKFYDTVDNYRQLDARGWMYHQAIADDIHDWLGFRGSFYDAYAEGARQLFWKQLDASLYTGLSRKPSGNKQSEEKLSNGKLSNCKFIDAWWMDASEPNVRDCTPMWYRKALCGPTALGTSTEYFNAYSLVNAQAIYEGQRSTNPDQRVFLLTRSGFAGLQRYSTATWSGDIGTRWEDMRAQMTAGLNYSMSGLPFWGMDQGGFCVENRYVKAQQLFDKTGTENEDLAEWRELQARWSQFGCFIPLFRVHGQWPTREIWNIAPEHHPAYRSFVFYDQLRYRLMPYLYSMAGWVHLKDYTMMRGLVMDFNDDCDVVDIKDQWMFGPALMACPVGYYKARSRSVYFPKGCGWYDLYTGRQIVDSKLSNRQFTVDAPYERIPVFVRAGSIIPFGPEIQYTDEHPAELIHLYVYAGRDGQFQLYEDEGTNYNYERGQYATIDIAYDDATRTVTLGRRHGQFQGMLRQRRFNIVLVTSDAPQALNLEKPEGKLVVYDGQQVSVQL